MKLCSIQPFSLAGAGGGPRIISSLLSDGPVDVLAVCTSPTPTDVVPNDVREVHLPSRPRFGRLESTRLISYLGAAEVPGRRAFGRRLAELLRREHVTCVHAVAHSSDFPVVHAAARELDLPFYLSIHDDPVYTLRARVGRGYANSHLGEAWNDAEERFVISSEMGAEMSRRFGEQSFAYVTDGLTEVAPAPRPPSQGPVTAYFMGAFHRSYRANLEALVSGAAQWQRASGREIRLVMRSGPLPDPAELDPEVEVEFRDWATQLEIDRDLAEVDLLYLPLPFGEEHRNFVRYSLSTKLVTYSGSGLPILFHGPRPSAASDLLEAAGAAAIVDSLEAPDIAAGIDAVARGGEGMAGAALDLARSRFMLEEIRNRFWSAIEAGASTSPAAAERAESSAPADARP